MLYSAVLVFKWLAKNWFLLGIVTALLLGFLLPGGAGLLNPRSITSTAIVIVLFLIIGVTLPSETIKSGLKDIRLHLFIQLFVFGFIPLYFFLTTRLLNVYIDPRFQVGIIALACLPTTVSSCIVFTQISGGNVVGTMFNASFSNVVGIFLSPFLLSLYLKSAGQALPASEMMRIFLNLCLKMLLPIVVGQLNRQFIKKWVTKNRKKLGIANNGLILCVVFLAISKAASNPLFIESLKAMFLPMIFLAVSHLAFVFLVLGGTKVLRFSGPNVISSLFAAPQKTLAMGVPLLSTYFAGKPEVLATAILPLIFYHAWQLIVAGFIRSSGYVRKIEEDAEAATSETAPKGSS